MIDLKKISLPELVGVGIVLVGAVVAGVVIRNIVSVRASLKEQSGPVAEVVAQPVELADEPAEPVVRVVAEVEAVAEEIGEVEPALVDEAARNAREPEADIEPEPEPFEQGDSKEIFKSAFDNMDLTEEQGQQLGVAMKMVQERF